MNRRTGIVKWFNVDKGFGFITDEQGQDYFVHRNAITTRGLEMKTLVKGDRVAFSIVQHPGGPLAENVVRTEMIQRRTKLVQR